MISIAASVPECEATGGFRPCTRVLPIVKLSVAKQIVLGLEKAVAGFRHAAAAASIGASDELMLDCCVCACVRDVGGVGRALDVW